ncbi:hypothetical protein [Staphylococcus pettenkoferi]|uniref:hypothetical protein n=1 Tax=Staphylococcus pettenkoferi TaxID=170573 RepID=UPI002275FF18|nr:hypothetical protein [Staphylococcus pettenkoferi]MCY1563857.1 hypothetical protein [Staphylococcus pettenkoferi]
MMTKKEAYQVCKTVEAYFNFELTDKQLRLWTELLMERGDYEETMKKVKNRATSEIPFKPMLNEVIAKPYQQNINTNREVRRMDKATREKFKQRVKEIEKRANEGELTIDDL